MIWTIGMQCARIKKTVIDRIMEITVEFSFFIHFEKDFTNKDFVL